MTRSPDELRAEITRWKRYILDRRGDRRASIEAAGAAIIVSALTWASGEIASPTVRVKIR